MVEVPEGVTRGGGGVVMDAAPPPQPVTATVIQKNAAERAPKWVKRRLQATSWNARAFLLKNANNRKSRTRKVGTDKGTREIGGMRRGATGGNWAGPLVVTVTVKVAGVPLASETFAGTWQTAPRGAPLQLSPTVPVKPVPGVS